MKKKRLSKTLAAAGVASRRACETLIFEGRVSVNGKVVQKPEEHVCPIEDEIAVDGVRISSNESKVYFLLNKPAGFVCSTQPSKNAHSIFDLFRGVSQRLFTVGRLDADTMGLILVTNDGHLANRVIHPSSNVQKEYIALVDRPIEHTDLVKISKGSRIDGVFVKPLKVSKMRKNTVKVIVKEGKKHEVRLLLKRAGLRVLGLTRTRIGNLSLGSLPVGSYRRLSLPQIEKLFD